MLGSQRSSVQCEVPPPSQRQFRSFQTTGFELELGRRGHHRLTLVFFPQRSHWLLDGEMDYRGIRVEAGGVLGG